MLVKIGVVGSRTRNTDYDLCMVRNQIMWLINKYGIDNITLVSGGCPKGADKFAEVVAQELNLLKTMIIHKPKKSSLDKKLMKVNPKAAYAIINYARNTLIAQDSDILIACVSHNRKGGTEDTIKKFEKLKKGKVILC